MVDMFGVFNYFCNFREVSPQYSLTKCRVGHVSDPPGSLSEKSNYRVVCCVGMDAVPLMLLLECWTAGEEGLAAVVGAVVGGGVVLLTSSPRTLTVPQLPDSPPRSSSSSSIGA